MKNEPVLNTIEEAIEDIRKGKIVIVVDDEDRENEGDFICAAECTTPEMINFMATYGRGLICTPITEDRAEELDLYPMVRENTSMHETAFTVSVDYLLDGCTTGISAYDRATGIRALVKPSTKPSDYARPGHIFPLRSKNGGVLRRSGHTEAATDLARLAGFAPCGVLVEILNEDGTMARLPQLLNMAKKHDLKIISIDDLIAYRLQKENLVDHIKEYSIQSDKYGELKLHVFRQITTGDDHIAVTLGSWTAEEPVLVRVQSSPAINNLESLAPGLEGNDIHAVLGAMKKSGKGAYLIMRHSEKISNLIDNLDSIIGKKKPEPNKIEIKRDIGIGAQILRELGIKKIHLMTNSLKRPVGIEGFDLTIEKVVGY